MGETQVGRGSAKPGSASGETGGGRRGQRARGSATTGGRAGYSVSGQRGRTERPDLHSVQGHTWFQARKTWPKQWQRQVDSITTPLAIKNKPEAERADAQEQLGPPFVYVWVAFLRSLASTKELGAEHVAVLRQYGRTAC